MGGIDIVHIVCGEFHELDEGF